LQLARVPSIKSFLVLFFKKEHTSFFRSEFVRVSQIRRRCADFMFPVARLLHRTAALSHRVGQQALRAPDGQPGLPAKR
jgi:hypothetical protein